MSTSHRFHERWIWTELIGFDNRDDDLGVGAYIEGAGFVPTGICLLLTSPDFILSHEDASGETQLPPDFCSRDGHEFNPHRQRQVWTNHQLKALIDKLHERGVQVFLTVFTRFYQNAFHHEWVSDHREVCMVFRRHGWTSAINSLSRLDDGSYYEDYFVAKLVQTLNYYGFDGWQGADGYGPLNGPLYEVSFSDDMVAQFAESTSLALPQVVTGECVHDTEKLEQRAAWIWRHARHDWITFYADRWAAFWRKMVDALHVAGKRAFINSSWGRAPFEALYRYGIDYRKIVDTGVDGIIVETVAAGLSMDPRPGAADETRHYDFLSMLMLMKAYVPEARLIFLHNAHDTVEEWDAIRHAPTVLEREIYSLANVFHTRADNSLTPCADGFLLCLGDGLDQDHWNWLRERWELAFSQVPRRVLGATLLWSDAAMHRQVDDFTHTRTWPVHRLLLHLMTLGAPVQSAVRIEDLAGAQGAILALNPHLLPDDELQALLSYQGGKVIAIGRHDSRLQVAEGALEDICPPMQLSCSVRGTGYTPPDFPRAESEESIPEDMLAVEDLSGYWDHLYCRQVSAGFLQACAKLIAEVSCGVTVEESADECTVMITEQAEGLRRIAIKNKTPFYMRPRIDLGGPIESVDILTGYPSLLVKPEGSSFSIRVPGKGITVVQARMGD